MTAPFGLHIEYDKSIDQSVKLMPCSRDIIFLSFSASNCSFIYWQSCHKYRLEIGMFRSYVWNISQTIVLQKIRVNCFCPKILKAGLQLSSVIR